MIRRRTACTLLLLLLTMLTGAELRAQGAIAGRHYLVAFPDTTRNLPLRLAKYFAAPTFDDVQQFVLFSEDTARVRLRGPSITIDTIVVPSRSTVISLDSIDRRFLVSPQPPAPGAPRRGITRDLFEITSDRDVSLTCFFATAFGAEAFTPIPVERWGTHHHVLALAPDSVLDVYTYFTQEEDNVGARYSPSQIAIIAAFDRTSITVTTPDSVDGRLERTIVLDAGEVVQIHSSSTGYLSQLWAELAGTIVVADKPVGVLSGNTRSYASGSIPMSAVTRNSMKNPLLEWMRPDAMHGRSFAYRSFGDVGGVRTGERVQIVALGPDTTWITTTAGPWGDRRLLPGESADLYIQTADTVDLNSFAIDASGPVAIAVYSGAHAAVGAPSNDDGFSPEVLGWSPAMTTLTPREAWFDYARFHVPAEPPGYAHQVTIVADPAAEIWLDGAPVVDTEPVHGTRYRSFTRTVTPGDHTIRTVRGRFSGTVSGRRRGNEAFRPMAARDREDAPDGVAPMHVATYAEQVGVSYAYPLVGTFGPADSLEASVTTGCDSLTIATQTSKRSIVDPQRYGAEVEDSINIRFRRDSILDGDAHIGWRLSLAPRDRSKDARGTIVLRDALAKVKRHAFTYRPSTIAIDPLRVALTAQPVGVGVDTIATITNGSSMPLDVDDLRLANGAAGFRLLDAIPLPFTIAPGASHPVRIEFRGDEHGRLHRDTLVVASVCARGTVPLFAQTISLDPEPVPAIEGHEWGARWLGSVVACTKSDTAAYAGHVRLENHGDRAFEVRSIDLAENDGNAFAIDNSIEAETIAQGTVVDVGAIGASALVQRIAFTPLEERAYRGMLRIVTTDDDTLEAILTGTGIESHIAVDPTTVALGSHILTTSGSELARTTMTVRARPTRTLTVRDLRLEGSSSIRFDRSGGFVPPSASDPATWWRLEPGASVDVPIVFAPDDTGSAAATLVAAGDHSRCDDSTATITARAYRSDVAVELTATIAPAIGCTGGVGQATLVNTGTVALSLVDATIVPASIFAFDPQPPVPVRLEPGARLSVPIRFTPPGAGAYQGEIAMTLRDPSGRVDDITARAAVSASLNVIAARAVVDSAHGLPGDLVAIDATLETPVDGAALASFDIEITYDRRVVRLLDATSENGIVEGWDLTVLERSDTAYRARLDGRGATLAGAGRLLTLTMQGHLGAVMATPIGLRIVPHARPCLEIATAPGRFTLDSICGMSFRQITAFAESYALLANHPNPFNPSTEIPFTVGTYGDVRIEILDARGRRVAVLVDAALAGGRYSVTWDASAVASGRYYCRMVSGDFVQVREMVLVR